MCAEMAGKQMRTDEKTRSSEHKLRYALHDGVPKPLEY